MNDTRMKDKILFPCSLIPLCGIHHFHFAMMNADLRTNRIISCVLCIRSYRISSCHRRLQGLIRHRCVSVYRGACRAVGNKRTCVGFTAIAGGYQQHKHYTEQGGNGSKEKVFHNLCRIDPAFIATGLKKAAAYV